MIEPGKRSGQPCIRGLRITAWDVLNWLAAGMTEQQIIDDYPELELEDFRAVYEFAARMGRRIRSVKLLFDENLSRKLVQRLADLYPGSAHVVGLDLMTSPDREIWKFTKAKITALCAR